MSPRSPQQREAMFAAMRERMQRIPEAKPKRMRSLNVGNRCRCDRKGCRACAQRRYMERRAGYSRARDYVGHVYAPHYCAEMRGFAKFLMRGRHWAGIRLAVMA